MNELLLEVLGLKALDRAGWDRVDVPRPESVAGHSWGVSWLVLVFLPEELDRERALAYAVLHDLPEVRVGDLTPADGVPAAEKAEREHRAMSALCAPLARGPELLALWERYEAQADPESRFVRQLDRLDMALQAAAYAQDGQPTLEFFDSADRFITEPILREVLERLRDRFS